MACLEKAKFLPRIYNPVIYYFVQERDAGMNRNHVTSQIFSVLQEFAFFKPYMLSLTLKCSGFNCHL